MKYRIISVMTFALLVIVAGLFAFTRSSDTPIGAKSYPDTVTNSTDNPDETPITDENYVWTGKDAEPKKIIISSIGVNAYIQKVAIDQRKEVGVPSNVHLAGWFTQSALPGETGLSVIDGHVDGKSQPGVFKNLDKLKKGSEFTIEYGNGKTTKFVVTGITKVAKQDAAAVLFSQDPAQKSQLNLVTCGGNYDKKARTYLDRIIVTSVPIPS